jgi:hypothetical protein
MDFRVLVDDSGGALNVRLFGRFDGEGVEELQRMCDGRVEAALLDLSALRSVDDVAAAYLRGLVDAGVKVGPINPYVSRLLEPMVGGRRPRRAT